MPTPHDQVEPRQRTRLNPDRKVSVMPQQSITDLVNSLEALGIRTVADLMRARRTPCREPDGRWHAQL